MAITEIPKEEKIDLPIDFCTNTIVKKAKGEERLVKQLVYTMLSAYTNNPINLAIKSPSGEGKSYVLNKVAENFPTGDVMIIAGMTDKALFHKMGRLVVKNELGDYESIKENAAKIDSEIEDKQSEISTTQNSDLKHALKNQIKELEQQKDELSKSACKLIDLSHKTIIFQDTPRVELLSAMMPLLSHDKYEVEYEYVETRTKNGIETRTNIIRGWPAVILCQAIDDTHHIRYPEIQRRFITTNPKMSCQKYSDAINLTGHKYGMPDFAYQEEIVNDEEKERAKSIILELKDKISSCVRLRPDKNNVIIPFHEAIAAALPRTKASDMTIANRLFTAISLSAIINVDNRPRYLLRAKGEPIMQTIPFATFDDLNESLLFVEDSEGLRRYVKEWYYDVFLDCYNSKNEPDSRTDSTDRTLTEKLIALTTEQLVKMTYEKQGKKLSKKQLLETYIYPLLNQGYIDATESDIDKRCKIYYPVISENNRNLFDSKRSNNLSQQILVPVRDLSIYPSKEYLTSRIQHILKYSSEKECYQVKKIVAPDNQGLSIKMLVDMNYQDPQNYFERKGISDEYSKNDKIASELQPISTGDIKPSQLQPEIHEKLFDARKSNNFLYSCYYCPSCETNDKKEYERHVVIHHPGKPGYPGQADLERHDLAPKGKEWEDSS